MSGKVVPGVDKVEELTDEAIESVAGGLYITQFVTSLWYKVRADNMYSPSLGGDFDDGRE